MRSEQTPSKNNLGQQAIKNPNEQSLILIQDGQDYFNAGQFEKARQAFIKVLEIDAANVEAHNNLGVLSWHNGDMHKAIESFKKALALDPYNEDAIFNLKEIQKVRDKKNDIKPIDNFCQTDKDSLRINIKGGIQVCVPSSIQLLTPYILLEQEDWFEEEIHFIRKMMQKGMNVIDIGANYGLYTLTIANIIGPSGKIWAFEPTSLTAAFLKNSISANHLTNIILKQAGLSEKNGFGKISLNFDPELNAITSQSDPNGKYETVELLSLDECEKIYSWHSIDFIKLDAEGHEHNIIKGGKNFFKAKSPLIMFELKHGDSFNTKLIYDFEELGYKSYYLVPGLNILAPIDLSKPFDPFQLNLFCCKADKAIILEAQGLLITNVSSSDLRHRSSSWRQGLRSIKCLEGFIKSWEFIGQEKTIPGWNFYENALNCYVAAHNNNLTSHFRYANLFYACEEVLKALNENKNVARMLTYGRIQSELGRRSQSILTAEIIFNLIKSEKSVIFPEPFIPISERFDRIIPEETQKWLLASIFEFMQKARSFSSFFTGNSSLNHLEMIKELKYETPEMERRRQLIRIRHGLQKYPEPKPIVSHKTLDNLNPEFWNPKVIPCNNAQNIISQLGIPHMERIQIVDISAMNIDSSQKSFGKILADGYASVIGFEPLEHECKKLNESTSANRKYLPYAVGDGTKKTFYITNTGMTSSLFEPNHNLTVKFQNLDELMRVIKSKAIQTVRLDDIPEILETDLLKIDAQGAEKIILENAVQVLKNVLVVQTEIEFIPLYKDQPLFAEIDQTLRKQDFVFHQFLGITGRAFKPLSVKNDINRLISQMLWADAVYVKDFMKLEKLSKQQLLKYAFIMHEVYNSSDLCHLVLTQYDNKTGLDLARKYLNCIKIFEKKI